MKSLLNPESLLSSISPIHIAKPYNLLHRQTQIALQFSQSGRHRWRGQKSRLTVKAALDQLGLKESDLLNPAISSSYRSSKSPRPNQTVLDAQTRVCTGPTQTKPLTEDQAFKVLDTILRSGNFFLHYEKISYHKLYFVGLNNNSFRNYYWFQRDRFILY